LTFHTSLERSYQESAIAGRQQTLRKFCVSKHLTDVG